MSVTARYRGSAHRIVRHFGGSSQCTFRRPHSLKSVATGGAVSLLVRGATLAGVAVIDLDATGLAGTLPKGCTFTIAGVAGTFTTTAATEAASGILSAVPITPVIPVGGAANDAAVTLTQEYGELAFYFTRDEFAADSGQTFLERNERRVNLSAIGAGGTPAVGDLLYSGDGQQIEYVRRVLEWAPAGVATGWTLHVGGEPR